VDGVVVMEGRTFLNLGRANDGTYETTNYAVAELMSRDRLLD
jgi:hypothetical protein